MSYLYLSFQTKQCKTENEIAHNIVNYKKLIYEIDRNAIITEVQTKKPEVQTEVGYDVDSGRAYPLWTSCAPPAQRLANNQLVLDS